MGETAGRNGQTRAPRIDGQLRKHLVTVPEATAEASGICVFGRIIKSLVFTTDVAIIKNCNADAVIAVYPFTPQTVITHALMMVATAPVFCGVGGGITTGSRVVSLAQDAEFSGAAGVVVNAPTSLETIRQVAETVDIPVVCTIVSERMDYAARIEAGCKILNISGAGRTADIVRAVRKDFPDIPIIATGGATEESVLRTIEAGANAITYTPPTTAELFRAIMDDYRKRL